MVGKEKGRRRNDRKEEGGNEINMRMSEREKERKRERNEGERMKWSVNVLDGILPKWEED